MVVKLKAMRQITAYQFESSVIPYGSKTSGGLPMQILQFESSVIPYGSKTLIACGTPGILV